MDAAKVLSTLCCVAVSAGPLPDDFGSEIVPAKDLIEDRTNDVVQVWPHMHVESTLATSSARKTDTVS